MDRSKTRDGPKAADPPWDLSQEREFIENLLCQRFNFLLLFYSLVAAGAFATQSQTNFSIILTLGALICTLATLPIARAQHKLELILKHIRLRDARHPSCLTDEWASDLTAVPWLLRPLVRRSTRTLIGYWIPVLCSASLWIGAVLSWFRVLRTS